MKILELHVEGFRSLKNVTWRPESLNVIIGPNGAGKSNLLRLLEMVSVASQGSLSKFVQAAGGMEPLVWDGRSAEIMTRIKTTPLDTWRPLERDRLTYELILARLGQTSGYRIEHELLGKFYRVERGEMQQPFKFLERDPRRAVVYDADEKSLMAPAESIPEDETLLSLSAGPFAYNSAIPPYQNQLAGWTIYHDLHVNRDAPIRLPVVAKMEKRVAPDGQNLVSVLHTLYSGDRVFKSEINNAMRAAFGDDFEELVFPPAADQRIQLRVRWRSLQREQSAADLSDGTLRFLFLLTVLGSPSAAPLIAIDEPESGLHPSMLPIIVEYAAEAARNSQVVFTTHSPSLLDAFRQTIPATSVACWEDGQTVLKTISGDTLAYWLKEYTLGHLFTSGELEAMQ